VSLSQTPASDRPSIYDELARGDGWEEINRDGSLIQVTKPGATGSQVQAQVERDGTFVFLMSDTVALDRLVTLATGLKPAPDSSAL
jgi:hypothetical protein